MATSKTILCNTFPITAKGGNPYKGLFCHDIEKALICIASGLGWHEVATLVVGYGVFMQISLPLVEIETYK